MPKRAIYYAPSIYQKLNGVFCIYKPRDLPFEKAVGLVKSNILRDLKHMLNYKYELEAVDKRYRLSSGSGVRGSLPSGADGESNLPSVPVTGISFPHGAVPGPDYPYTPEPGVATASFSDPSKNFLLPVKVSDESSSSANLEKSEPEKLNLAYIPEGLPLSQHRLVLGDRYQWPNVKLHNLHPLATKSSGLMVITIGRNAQTYKDLLLDANYVRVYHVVGRLGYMTDDFTHDGRLVGKFTYSHITKPKLDRVCMFTQNSHKKFMFDKLVITARVFVLYQIAWLVHWYVPTVFFINGLCKLLPWYIPQYYENEKTNYLLLRSVLVRMQGTDTPTADSLMLAIGTLELYATACVLIATSMAMATEGFILYAVLLTINLTCAVHLSQVFWAWQSASMLVLCLFLVRRIRQTVTDAMLTRRRHPWSDFLRILVVTRVMKSAGLEPNSQEAYEMASRGLIRPIDNETQPMLYGVKCIEFNPPDFTLEIHAINETCDYICNLVHDIGISLNSAAVTLKLRRVRYGFIDLDHALVINQWRIHDIIANMKVCNQHMTAKKLLTNHSLDIKKDSDEGGPPSEGEFMPHQEHERFEVRGPSRPLLTGMDQDEDFESSSFQRNVSNPFRRHSFDRDSGREPSFDGDPVGKDEFNRPSLDRDPDRGPPLGMDSDRMDDFMRPSFGRNSSRRPSFGGNPSIRPSFGRNSTRRPSFGRDSDRKPSFGGYSDRRPSFGRNSSRRSSFGRDSDRKPSFGRNSDRKPSFGGFWDRKPSFGRNSDRKPSFGGFWDRKPSFGRISDRKPSFGRNSDRKPSFGRNSDRRPSFGRNSDRKTSFGRNSNRKPSFERYSESDRT